MADTNDVPDDGIPQLEGWMTLPDAARELGITRSRVHQLVPGQLPSVRRIGNLKIVRTVEVMARKQRLQDARDKNAVEEVTE